MTKNAFREHGNCLASSPILLMAAKTIWPLCCGVVKTTCRGDESQLRSSIGAASPYAIAAEGAIEGNEHMCGKSTRGLAVESL